MSVVEHNLKYEHPHIQKILKKIEELYRHESDESLEQASKMYAHLANLCKVLANDIDKELSEQEVIVFGTK